MLRKNFALVLSLLVLLSAFFALPAAATHVIGENLVTNPDFETTNDAETWAIGWTLYESQNRNKLQKEENGNHYVQLTLMNGFPVRQKISITETDVPYEISFDVKSSAAAQPQVEIYFYTQVGEETVSLATASTMEESTGKYFRNTGSGIYSSKTFVVDDTKSEWHRVSYGLILPENTTEIELTIGCKGSEEVLSECAVDNVVFRRNDKVNFVNVQFGSSTQPINITNAAGLLTAGTTAPDGSLAGKIYFGGNMNKGSDIAVIQGGKNYIFEFDVYADTADDTLYAVNVPLGILTSQPPVYVRAPGHADYADGATTSASYTAGGDRRMWGTVIQTGEWHHLQLRFATTGTAPLLRAQLEFRNNNTSYNFGSTYYIRNIKLYEAGSTGITFGNTIVTGSNPVVRTAAQIPSDGQITAYYYAEPINETNLNGTVFICAYGKGEDNQPRLLDVKTAAVNITDGTGVSGTIDFTQSDVSEIEEIKAYIWDGTLKPVAAEILSKAPAAE